MLKKLLLLTVINNINTINPTQVPAQRHAINPREARVVTIAREERVNNLLFRPEDVFLFEEKINDLLHTFQNYNPERLIIREIENRIQNLHADLVHLNFNLNITTLQNEKNEIFSIEELMPFIVNVINRPKR